MNKRSTKNVRVRTDLPWGCAALIDSLIGTVYGETREEVIRFALVSWTTTNIAAIGRQIDARRDYDAAQAAVKMLRRKKRESK